MVEITVNNQIFKLLPERAIYWVDTRTLILTDIHLGKSGHFRKSGIAAPQQINETNLRRMGNLVDTYKPDRVFILGDLFHSEVNREWLQFEEWLSAHSKPQYHLITGNHDILHSSFYEQAEISTHKTLTENGLRFTHHPSRDSTPETDYNLCGHIHPGIRLKGTGRQALTLPCFYLSGNQIILPAFGEFTGLFTLKIEDAEKVYAIANNEVISLKK